ncbi:hypothetical protein BDQ17DRAFT_1380899 [Cyathus striatus]|nr:hypothetical protein BDQ17DRAFT_1380899 [Cyathus striatus]
MSNKQTNTSNSTSNGNTSTSTSNSNTNSGSSSTYTPPSNNSYYKPYGGWPNFMASYGLKPWDDDDVQEGHAIVDAFKEQDRLDWEEANKGRK